MIGTKVLMMVVTYDDLYDCRYEGTGTKTVGKLKNVGRMEADFVRESQKGGSNKQR